MHSSSTSSDSNGLNFFPYQPILRERERERERKENDNKQSGKVFGKTEGNFLEKKKRNNNDTFGSLIQIQFSISIC